MNLQQLQQEAAHHHDKIQVRVVCHGGSQLYQIECQELDGQSCLIRRRGKPQLYRSLDAVYDELRHIGIREAYLVQHASNDDFIGHDAGQCQVATAHLPLSF